MRKGILIFSLLLIAILLLFSLVSGEDWIPINKEGNKSVSIDEESIKHSSSHAGKDIIRAVGKVVYAGPETFGSKPVSYVLRHYEFYCNEKSFRLMQIFYYYADGTKESQIDPTARQWKKIDSDTIDSVMYKYLCEKDK